MDDHFNLQRLISMIFIFLILAVPTIAQPASRPAALLEVAHEHCWGGDCDSYTFRIYADGKLTAEGVTSKKAKSGRLRKILSRLEMRLEPEELAELVSLAEKPDFLNALPEYSLKIVQDSPSWVTVTYRKEKLEKKVTIGNYLIANDAEKAKLPPSLWKIIELSQRLTD